MILDNSSSWRKGLSYVTVRCMMIPANDIFPGKPAPFYIRAVSGTVDLLLRIWLRLIFHLASIKREVGCACDRTRSVVRTVCLSCSHYLPHHLRRDHSRIHIWQSEYARQPIFFRFLPSESSSQIPAAASDDNTIVLHKFLSFTPKWHPSLLQR